MNETTGFGSALANKIRETADYEHLSRYDKFVLDRGFEFETEEALAAAYSRSAKAAKGILLSKEEFITEAERIRPGRAEELYDVLTDLAEQGAVTPLQVYDFARFNWCMDAPEAVVVNQTGPKSWAVNTCACEYTVEKAILKINAEWGFEASRIEILGTPYYGSTDWNYIRFDCAGMAWVMCNGDIDAVFQ